MINLLPVYSKLISETLLSLYPIFVKKINLPLDLQLWIRLITYVLLSLFFINYTWVSSNLFNFDSIFLSLINMLHIYCSYQGFFYLDSGVAFSIFNIYPILILLFSGVSWKSEYFLAIIGLIFFIYSSIIEENKKDSYNNFIYGFGMILLSAITEAIIYFIVKNIKTDNNWNHLFLAYFLGSILTSLYTFKKYIISNNYFNDNITDIKLSEIQYNINFESLSLLGLALMINGIIGTLGYYFRFYSISRLDHGIYSILTFFGILTAYFYGIIFNNESIDLFKIIGTILIILSNLLIL